MTDFSLPPCNARPSTRSPATLAAVVAAAALTLPAVAQAGDFETRTVAGCTVPAMKGAQTVDQPASSFEQGTLNLATRSTQLLLSWLPGSSQELTAEQFGQYATAFGESGVAVDVAAQTWAEVDGEKALRAPVTFNSGPKGEMVMWSSRSSGRFFIFVLAAVDPGKSAAVAGQVDEAAALFSCEGSGRIEQLYAAAADVPDGWTVEISGLPTVVYTDRDASQSQSMWSTVRSEGRLECGKPATVVFQQYARNAGVKLAPEMTVVADGGDASAEWMCHVKAGVEGWSEAGGDTMHYRTWACPETPSHQVNQVVLVSGAAAESVHDLRASTRCVAKAPEAKGPPPAPKSDAGEKTQWVPGQ